ncbi:unnamed protein product, partial [Polarella glacialis]
ARRSICAWLPLFTSVVAAAGKEEGQGGSSGSRSGKKKGLEHEVATGQLLDSLADILVPEEPACWRRLAQRWRSVQVHDKTSDQDEAETAWLPAMRLWMRSRGEELVGPPSLRGPVMRRVLQRLQDAAGSAKASPSKRRKQLEAILGLTGGLERVLRIPLQGLPADVVAAALHQLISTISLACQTCSEAAAPVSEEVECRLLVASLACTAVLLERMAEEAASLPPGIVQEAVSLLTGDGAMPME